MKVNAPVLMIAALVAVVSPSAVLAQTAAPNKDESQNVALSGATSSAAQRDDAGLDGRQPSLLQDQRAGRRAPPFGAQLFSQSPPPPGGPILDPAYVMKPGDTVAVTQWGLVNSTTQTVVDPKGNIVVPGLGPVAVGGLSAGQVDEKVKGVAGNTFRNSVQTYASPLSATTIQVFVTGAVLHPGVYAGSSTDSIVGFLQRAGGPDPDRGSYRHIQIKRGGEIIANADLYGFLLNGSLPAAALQQGDVIVVGPQGPIVTVSGDARAPFTFELASSGGSGAELLRYARPRPEVTDTTVLAIRDAKPVNIAEPLASFAARPLSDGDRVRFEANARSETYVIQVEGAVEGQATFVVPRGARLADVLAQLHLDPLADRSMIHLRRVSAARTQKQLLDESLARLEKAIYTTPAPSSSIAQARQVDTAALQQFVERARTVQPEGIVSLQGLDPTQLVLEPDDVVVVPYRSQLIFVGGEVALPQSLIASGGQTASALVQRAGGFGARANRGQILVIRPDGSAHIGGTAQPGDRVLVPPKVSESAFDLIRDISTILYQLGVAAAAVIR